MIRKKVYWIALIVIIAVIGGGYLLYTNIFTSTAAESEEPSIQTALARQGDLIVFASGAGTVIPATEINIGFDESGTLAELMVKVGDQVNAGQIIAGLQTDKTQEEVALAIAEAELNVLTAQQALDDIYELAQIEAAEALLTIEEAQEALDDLQNNDLRLAQAVQAAAEAEEAVKDAERIYNSTRLPAGDNTIAAAYAELVIAESNLEEQEEKFNDYANKPDDNLEKANRQLKLSQAQGAYDTALRYYNAVTGTGSELDLELSASELATAQAQLAEAQKELERVQTGPTPGELAMAEAELAVAQSKYETLKNGADPAEIALAEANLANAKAKLAVAMEDQAVVDLVAPMTGTILSINANIGEALGASSFITMADLSQPNLEIYLDETDLDNVGLGYEVEVVFDSLPDNTFTGHVIQVDPSLQSISNVDTIVALVQLDTDSFSKPQSLPVGSNASVDVIGGRTENAVLVPVEAIRELGPDEYAVFVMEEGEPKLRIVTVGIMDYTSAEITSGLEAGEEISTGVIETN